MPIIRIDYDDSHLSKEDIQTLSHGIQEIVSRVTGIEDVFVYANSAQVTYKIAPIEIFVEMSASKITDVDILITDIKKELVMRKTNNTFTYLINLTLIPMNWKIEIGI